MTSTEFGIKLFMKHLTMIVMNKSWATCMRYNNKEATWVNTKGLEESLIAIMKIDIYYWWMTTQKIRYTHKLNFDVGSECDNNCSFELSMLLVIMINISKWDHVVGRMSLSPLQKCTAAIRILAYGSYWRLRL